jgi:hypothetical protein
MRAFDRDLIRGGHYASGYVNRALLARRPTKVAAIALANKIARMAWVRSRSRRERGGFRGQRGEAAGVGAEAISKREPH